MSGGEVVVVYMWADERGPGMLVVDPLKRITIPEIRQHPWFQTNLPAYLAHPPAEITSRTISHIDENILAELCQVSRCRFASARARARRLR
jgi:hypothetical protein